MQVLWTIVCLPFSLLGGLITQVLKLVSLVGRAACLLLGFSMMVIGTALAGMPVWRVIGIPLFVVGLLFTLSAFR